MTKKLPVTESREKWFESRMAFMIFIVTTIIAAVLAIYIPIGKIQTDIAVINSNHEAHMQDLTTQMKTQNDQIVKLEDEQTELLKQVTETQTLIKMHMGLEK